MSSGLIERLFRRSINERVRAALSAFPETDATFAIGSRLG